MGTATVATLRRWRRRQLEERMRWGEGYQDHGLVFAREDGSPIRPAWLTRRFVTLADTAGLPLIRLHDCRHTWATLALRAGVHPKVVSERLGHSSIGITLDTYSHVVSGMQAEAAERVASMFVKPAGT